MAVGPCGKCGQNSTLMVKNKWSNGGMVNQQTGQMVKIGSFRKNSRVLVKTRQWSNGQWSNGFHKWSNERHKWSISNGQYRWSFG
jgi:hypothetical protein